MARDTDPGQLTTAPSSPLEAVFVRIKHHAVTLKRFAISKPMGAAGAIIVLVIVLAAVFAPVVSPYDPYASNLDTDGLPVRLVGPSASFPLGTDAIGRDDWVPDLDRKS